MKEVYVSVDVETDGPIPGRNSLLSLGAAAFALEGESWSECGTFSVNLEIAEGAEPDPRTREWWEANPEAWEQARIDCVPPPEGMHRFVAWLEALPGRPVFVGYPSGFDFTFTYWYLVRYAGRSPFSFSAVDMKTMAMTLLGCGYRDVNKKLLKRHWPSRRKHSHVALDDALEQGEIFCRMLLDSRGRVLQSHQD